MKELNTNIYTLLVMKWINDPSSVSKEERRKNKKSAFYSSGGHTYAATFAASAAAADDNYEGAEFWVNKYFELTGEDKQDYRREQTRLH